MAYLNPELIQKSEYIDQLHAIEQAMFIQGQHWHSFHAQQEIERIRIPIAFLDMLFRSQRIQHALYLTIASSAKVSVAQSFGLHTQLICCDIIDENTTAHVVLASLHEFANLDEVQSFLNQFDCVVVEHSDLKLYELVQYRLKYIYRKAVFELVYKPQRLYL